MNLIFAGIQGSGKGTQAEIIAKKLGIAHISTGDLLRGAEGELKEKADSYEKEGKLVPSGIVISILKKRIKQKDCEKGFILDGFPRTIGQARELDKLAKIDNVFNIEISDEEAIKRLKGRWNCKKCGIDYNYVTSPKPKKEGVCDKCGEKLYQRDDDINDKAIQQRLKLYHEDVAPILKFYNTIKVNGEQPIEQVTQDIEKAIKFLTMFK
jgi:adenylate kinase